MSALGQERTLRLLSDVHFSPESALAGLGSAYIPPAPNSSRRDAQILIVIVCTQGRQDGTYQIGLKLLHIGHCGTPTASRNQRNATAKRTGVWTEHKFKIGKLLFFAEHLTDGAYVVIKRLPKREREFEYQIRSVDEPAERVVRESQLRPNFPLGSKRG
jgi:hypothetical protein